MNIERDATRGLVCISMEGAYVLIDEDEWEQSPRIREPVEKAVRAAAKEGLIGHIMLTATIGESGLEWWHWHLAGYGGSAGATTRPDT